MKEYVLYGDGIHDDFPYIQNALDSGIKVLNLPLPKKFYKISSTILISSGQSLVTDKNTIIRLAPNSNCFMISNKNQEKGDSGISVIGGIWDMDNANQASNPNTRATIDKEDQDVYVPFDQTKFYAFVNSDKPYHVKSLFDIEGDFLQGFLMAFYNVKNLVIKDLTLKDPVMYGGWFGKVDGFHISNVTFDYNYGNYYPINMDGLHFESGCKNGTIKNLDGACYDDTVAFTDEIVKGDSIENIVVDGIYAYDSHSAVRFLSAPDKVRNITVKNITGTFYQYAVGFTKYYVTENNEYGEFSNITLENFDVARAKKYPRYRKGTNSDLFPIIWIEQQTCVKNLVIKNFKREEYISDAPMLSSDENSVMKNVKIENMEINGHNGIKPRCFDIKGKNDKVEINAVYVDGEKIY